MKIATWNVERPKKTGTRVKHLVDCLKAIDADILIFPDFQTANAFYKGLATFAHAEMAGLLQGPEKPVVLTSRSESVYSKFCSICMACILC